MFHLLSNTIFKNGEYFLRNNGPDSVCFIGEKTEKS